MLRSPSVLLILFPGLFPKVPVLAALLLIGTGGLLPLDGGDLCRAALVPVGVLVDALGEDLAGDLAVLVAGAGGLGFDDDIGGEVLELDGRVCLVLVGDGSLKLKNLLLTPHETRSWG